MKKWYIFVAIFSFCGEIVSMANGQPVDVVVHSSEGYGSDDSGQENNIPQESVMYTEYKEVIIYMEDLLKKLELREQERKQEKHKRCFGKYWLIRHVPAAIQIVGSIASVLGVILIYYS
ncbi:MAG TPA: hypothetical protein PLU71_03560 [Candidatus Dependentiae bacterium]|nr:hypothetical protein [Candidatus Dependentiae bacterium]HRQ62910.1 hypothetical protein [Candidatus Dependentiae bacterium]